MKNLLLLTFISVYCLAFAQNHKVEIKKITSVAEARSYASKYREVSVSLIDENRDKFLFAQLDTSDMKSNIGREFDNYGRVTVIIQDTIVEMVEIELIQFDLNKTSEESTANLMSQLKKRMANGDDYYALKEKFDHTSAYFYTGPRIIQRIKLLSPEELQVDSDQWKEFSYEDLRGYIRLKTELKPAKAFHVVGYNSN